MNPLNIPAEEVSPRPPSASPVLFTDSARNQVRAALAQEADKPAGLRLAVIGGGCAGFQYTMNFENTPRPGDTEWDEDGFRVFVDKMSITYLEGVQVDWVTDRKSVV